MGLQQVHELHRRTDTMLHTTSWLARLVQPGPATHHVLQRRRRRGRYS